MYKGKLLGDTDVEGANGFFRNSTIPLKVSRQFWRSLKMPLNNCRIKSKRKRTRYYVLASSGTENSDAGPNNIIFTIKDTKLYISVVTSAEDNQKPSRLLSKGFERLVYWNEYETKSESKNAQMSMDIFSNQTF